MEHKFSIKKTYYRDTVYEFNLPTGHSCPYAVECLVSVDRETGKFLSDYGEYRCYASSAERFPGVRGSRWANFDYVKDGGVVEIPEKAKAVRIHSSGDFFSQKYFDMWLDVIRANPSVEFWAYTKSLPYWIKRINEIPENLVLTASYGSKNDNLIEEYDLKSALVVDPNSEVAKDGSMPIDLNDDVARLKDVKFILLDNNKKVKKEA